MADGPLSKIDPAQFTLLNGVLTGPEDQRKSLVEALAATHYGEERATPEYRNPALTDRALRLTYK
ncbi:hypothetical protein [Tateyamaria pelophila]|uniref:hypothetical protein n=1 Tax=Tateyamaria pelophila TaxID=328415 RepID=UPI001CBD842E|nr:hypothetical protein [Tateyamaria pelophila]